MMNGCSLLSPSRTVVTSFTPRKPSLGTATAFEDGDWVLGVVADDNASNSNTFTCALSDCQLIVYQAQRLHRLQSYDHGSLVSDFCYGPNQTLVATSADDASLKVYDLRQPTVALQAHLPSTALSVSLGYDGTLAAVGSKARIHFLDLRQTAVVGSYVDSHTDGVTQVRMQGTRLLSGAEDGLACVYDTTQPTEEAALETVFNVGSPLRKVGFCNTSSIYCLTGSETASIWNCETGMCEYDFGGHALRDHLSKNIGIPVDYLVDAHWDGARQELLLVAGGTSGDAGVFGWSNTDDPMGANRFEPHHVLSGGHRGVVRAWCPLPGSLTIVTAGEDARLCEWSRCSNGVNNPQAPRNMEGSTVGNVHYHSPTTSPSRGGLLRRQHKRHKQSNSPY